MTTPTNEGPTILPTGEGPDRNTPATDDPQHATALSTQTVHDPVVEAQDDDLAMPATPGAAAMPVHDDPVVHETPEPSGAHAANGTDQEWLALQGRFVDDPAAAVREAGETVVREFESLRTRLEAGSTEDLRTAFQRYRSLHEALEKEASL